MKLEHFRDLYELNVIWDWKDGYNTSISKTVK